MRNNLPEKPDHTTIAKAELLIAGISNPTEDQLSTIIAQNEAFYSTLKTIRNDTTAKLKEINESGKDIAAAMANWLQSDTVEMAEDSD